MSEVPEEKLLVYLYPGLPSTAELFVLPDEDTSSEHKKGSKEGLEMVRAKICKEYSLAFSGDFLFFFFNQE